MTEPEAVLEFWFGPPDAPDFGWPREAWFQGGPEFDELCRRFEPAVEEAFAGGFDDWRWRPRYCLALILLLDQFPRNIYRGTARAFAGDPRAREFTRFALARGFDRAVPAALRTFLYMPLEHSEALADQDLVVRLFDAWGSADSREYARRHRKVIRRFGRFPHRNAVLGRPSTPEEKAFAAEPKNRFGQ